MRMQVADCMGVSQREYRDAARAAISAADIVEVSDEDLHHLGFTAPPVDAARALLTDLCKVVVVTMGASGAWGLTAADQIYQPAELVSVVDSVGAGDCFFAGLIAALICGGAIATLRGAAPSQPTLARALRRD